MKSLILFIALFNLNQPRIKCEYITPFKDENYEYVKCLKKSPFEVSFNILDNMSNECVEFKHNSSKDIVYGFFREDLAGSYDWVVLDTAKTIIWTYKFK